MPLSEAEQTLVEAMFKNKCNIKLVQQVIPHAVQSTLYRMKTNYDTFGSIHKPESVKKRPKKQPEVRTDPKRPPPTLNDSDRDVIETLFAHGCTVNAVKTWVPKATRSTLYRMRSNYAGFQSVRKPESAKKKKGRPTVITPEMKEWLFEFVSTNKEMWQRDLAYELFVKFNVFVSPSTISRLLKDEKISKRAEATPNIPATGTLDPRLQ